MSTSPRLFPESPTSAPPARRMNPRWIVFNLVVIIFLAEVITMTILYLVDIPSYMLVTILDGLIMILLILPGLYYLQLRPLQNQIQNRIQLEQALRYNEGLLRKVLELLPVGVWLTDEKGEITYGNPAGQAIWAGARYVGKERFGEYKAWWLSTGKRIEPDEWAVARAIDKGETSLNEEIEIECFDGSHKIILNSAVPVVDDQGGILWAFVVNQDITERKRREQELIHTNELLEKFINSIHILVAYLDRDFNFLRVNEAYAKAAGHQVEFFYCKNHFDLYPHEENLSIFQRVVDSGEPYIVYEKPFEYAEYPERGVTYWDWSLQPVKGAEGKVEALVFSLLDVTERKRAEIQLARQNQELLELSNAEHKQRELAESLVQVTLALSSSLQLEEVLKAILDQIHRTIPFKAAAITLLENQMVQVVGYRIIGDLPPHIEVARQTYPLDEVPFWLKVYSTRHPRIIFDTHDSPDWQNSRGIEWIRCYAGAPLIAEEEVIGFINLVSDHPGSFNEEMISQLTAFAVPAALAIQNARLYSDELKARKVAEMLRNSAQTLSTTLNLEQVIDTLADFIQGITRSDTIRVSLMEGENRLILRAVRGAKPYTYQEQIPEHAIDRDAEAVMQKLITDRRSIFVPKQSSNQSQGKGLELESSCNWLISPIIASDRVIGTVGSGSMDEVFNPETIELIEALISQAAVAIQNAWLFQQVSSSSERLQSLARTLVEIQENERAYIARELHDEAGQALSLLKLNLGRLEKDPGCTQHIRQRLGDLKGVTDSVLDELHRLAVDLRPTALDHLGLVAALEQHARNLTSDELSIQFMAVGFDGARLSKEAETCLYRIVQEALANVIRHAQANNVGILLEWVGSKLKLFIEDDGIGFSPDLPEHKHSMGLVGMRERAEMLGGMLTIESSTGKGTSIVVEVADAYSYLDRR